MYAKRALKLHKLCTYPWSNSDRILINKSPKFGIEITDQGLKNTYKEFNKDPHLNFFNPEHTPYPTFWLGVRGITKGGNISRYGILYRYNQSHNNFVITVATCDSYGRWGKIIPSWAWNYDASLGKSELIAAGTDKELKFYLSIVGDNDYMEQSTMIMGSCTSALIYTTRLLNCKNVETVATQRRTKRGSPTGYKFHKLVVRPLGGRSKGETLNLHTNRFHSCRGHFRTYTAEKPLFGKWAGTYWIQPHARGRKSQGVVEKDYIVKEA